MGQVDAGINKLPASAINGAVSLGDWGPYTVTSVDANTIVPIANVLSPVIAGELSSRPLGLVMQISTPDGACQLFSVTIGLL